jgi:acyl carrier protein
MKEENDNDRIFTVVAGIIRHITGNPGLKIEPAYKAGDIRNWDSLHHVMIINEIENYFNIQFDLMEMLDISSVGDICNAISRKKAIPDDHP